MPENRHCLNCGASLAGRFCGSCGQRDIPAYPTVAELLGDAWHELSGYDGRFARTFRLLLGRPGALTVEAMEGRRARYVSPVRIYLVASVAYFLIAAATPRLPPASAVQLPGSKVTVDLTGRGAKALSPELRAQVLKDIDRAPRIVRPFVRAVVSNPEAFRGSFRERLPRVLFALVPVFASILMLFYRRRPFSQHLIFALHLHAAIFTLLIVQRAALFTHRVWIIGVAETVVLVSVAAYALLAFRRVYRDSWTRTVVKALGIGLVYLIATLIGITVTITWVVFGSE